MTTHRGLLGATIHSTPEQRLASQRASLAALRARLAEGRSALRALVGDPDVLIDRIVAEQGPALARELDQQRRANRAQLARRLPSAPMTAALRG